MDGEDLFGAFMGAMALVFLLIVGSVGYSMGVSYACDELRLRVGVEVHAQAVRAEICR